jgi:hypothetical protein
MFKPADRPRAPGLTLHSILASRRLPGNRTLEAVYTGLEEIVPHSRTTGAGRRTSDCARFAQGLGGGHSSPSPFSRMASTTRKPRLAENSAQRPVADPSPLSGSGRKLWRARSHRVAGALARGGESPCPWQAARQAQAACQSSVGATQSSRKAPAAGPRRSISCAHTAI